MLSKETLELIQTTAQSAQAAQLLPELNTDGRKAYVQQGIGLREIVLPPPNRTHRVHRLDDLIAYANRTDNLKPVVWHGVDGVVLLPDDSDRRDVVLLPLEFSERYRFLASLAAEPKAIGQAQLIRLLRINLGIEALLVQKFRRLDWSNGADGTSEVTHGNARVQKSILAKVQGVDELPDELPVSVPVYAQCGERDEFKVRCYLEVDPQNQLFEIGPMSDELTRIVDLAQASIRSRLKAGLLDEIPLYHGSP